MIYSHDATEFRGRNRANKVSRQAPGSWRCSARSLIDSNPFFGFELKKSPYSRTYIPLSKPTITPTAALRRWASRDEMLGRCAVPGAVQIPEMPLSYFDFQSAEIQSGGAVASYFRISKEIHIREPLWAGASEAITEVVACRRRFNIDPPC